jgi:hypothetical protein
MMRRKLALLVLATAALAGVALVAGSVRADGKPKTPKRVLIVLFDQMRPDYPDRFGMTNVKKLRDEGTSFEDAYLGYMGSETVISHNVIVSGQAPNHMGWVDEAYRDTHNLFGKNVPGESPKMHITGDLALSDFETLIAHEGYPKLSDYLHGKSPGSKFIVVGQKSYAVESAVAGSGDIAVRMSGRGSASTCPALGGRWRSPAGRNVPTYLTTPTCGRFYVNSDSGNDYGTKAAFPSWMYPEDGNRFFPGTDSAHLGGDVWVADAAMAMMENENWSGMFVTLGGIDKAGHMWGADHDTDGHDCAVGTGQVHVDCAAKIADQQLGRILQKLDDLGQLDETLIVLTADHGATHGGTLIEGGTTGSTFYGRTGADAGNSNWYYGKAGDVIDAGAGGVSPGNLYDNPSPLLQPLLLTGNVQFNYQSTSIQSWLRDTSDAKKEQAAEIMLSLPGVTASYVKDGDHFKLFGTNHMTKSEEKWWKKTAKDIVDTLAADSGPDVVGLLHDDVSYGVYGDHGGASEEVQRVPVVFWSAGAKGGASGEDFQSTDILPTILKELGIKPTHKMDGKARNVK